jgi:gamma-glutamyltranspeptidase/glutathione hydrolase
MRRFFRVILFVIVGIVAVAAVLAIVYAFLPKGPRDPMEFADPTGQPREVVTAREYAVVTGSPWATDAALGILDSGGNAFDAAVAALLMLNVTNGEAASFPGIAPTMIYNAASQTTHSYTGAGTAPAAATIDYFTAEGHTVVPDLSILAQLLPASPDVMIRLLADYGTMSFTEVSRSAIELAREGFPVTTTMAKNLDFSLLERIGLSIILGYNAKVYLDNQFWRPVHAGDRFRRPDLAATWEKMAAAEQEALASGATHNEALRVVRDYFYTGPVAEAILALHERRNGLFTADDLAGYTGSWEEPLVGRYDEYAFHTNSGWTQGVTALLALQILEGIDLLALGHNSAAYVHAVVQALELAYADREAYVGDPAFVDVPFETLLSPEYANLRRRAMTANSFGGLPAPGRIDGYEAWIPPVVTPEAAGAPSRAAATMRVASAPDFAIGKDTSQLVVVDAAGNAVAITPSDFPKSPMVPDTGMTLGNRMVQFRLDPASPTALEPGKRPRVTPHAVVVMKDGEFWMAYNTPGGDMQPQALVQVFLNMEVFGMGIQEAISAPRFRTLSVPSSFSPHESEPGTLWLEAPLHQSAGIELAAYGYDVVRREAWDNEFGAVGAVQAPGDGLLAAADPREATWAGGL